MKIDGTPVTEARALNLAQNRDPKSAPWKVAIAAEMKATTVATNRWLAISLAMGSPWMVSRLASRCRADPGDADPYLRMIAKHKA